MSMFAFILLLLSGTHPDRRCAIADVGIRWAEAAVGGPGESGEEGMLSSYLTCFNKWSVSREPGVYGER